MINLVGGPAVCYSCSGRSALLPPLCHGDSRGTCGRRVLSRCPKPSAAFRSPGRGGFYLLYYAPTLLYLFGYCPRRSALGGGASPSPKSFLDRRGNKNRLQGMVNNPYNRIKLHTAPIFPLIICRGNIIIGFGAVILSCGTALSSCMGAQGGANSLRAAFI